eukprot:gene22192-29252_t
MSDSSEEHHKVAQVANPPSKLDLWADGINEKVNNSWVGSFFDIEGRNSTFFQELRAGFVCFLTVCYIIPVNAGILTDSGGTCDANEECLPENYARDGENCRFYDPGFASCLVDFRKSLISATCIAAMIGTMGMALIARMPLAVAPAMGLNAYFTYKSTSTPQQQQSHCATTSFTAGMALIARMPLAVAPAMGSTSAPQQQQSHCAATFLTAGMALIARMPLAVAPAMGVNAYFTYNVIGFLGSKSVTYEDALAAAFIEGWIFIFISITGVRGRLVELIPKDIMYATAAGIGMFLAFIGLQKSEGLGFVTMDGATLVALGGCPKYERAYAHILYPGEAQFINDCLFAYVGANFSDPGTIALQMSNTEYPFTNSIGPSSANYACFGAQVRSPTLWLGIAGGFLMVVLMMSKVKASILYGILFVTFISWIPNHAATYFEGSDIPGGAERFDFFKDVVTVPTVEKSGGKLHFSGLAKGDTWIALITFLYLDFLDATSCMFTLARQINDKVPNFVNSRGSWPRQLETMVVDGASIVIGSTLGTSPLTVFAESAVGIREGGTTGITAFVVAVGFGVSMFFAPIFASIPPYATGPAIFFVGALMMEHSRHVNWENVRVAVPAFITIIIMPLTYSIAYGVICGISFNIALWIAEFVIELFMVVAYKSPKGRTVKHVMLRTLDSWYVAFDKEDYLVEHLPGYKLADRNQSAFSERPCQFCKEHGVGAHAHKLHNGDSAHPIGDDSAHPIRETKKPVSVASVAVAVDQTHKN